MGTALSYAHDMRQTVPGGLLIAVEGIDGAGKTSICTLLAQWCGERGVACMLSKEPTGLKWGKELRESAKNGRLTLERELELFELDRRDHVDRAIKPALDDGCVVILDRYYWSTAAYQGARGANVEEVICRNEVFAPRPDVVILLDVPPELGLQRIGARGDLPNAFEELASLSASREIFQKLHTSCPGSFKVDSSEPLSECWKICLAILLQACAEKLANKHGATPEGVKAMEAFFDVPPL